MSRRAYLTGPLVIGALGLLLLALVGYRSLSQNQATGPDVFGDAPAFALIDHLERPVRSGELQGKVVVANFIYTNCPDVCPLLSVRMQALQERLRRENLLGSQVQLLSFTVDPARDTPAVLRAYAERHRADPLAWRFLTGPEDELIPLVVKGFHLGVQALPPATDQGEHADGHDHQQFYEVMHSGRFVLIDRQWRIRAYYDGRDLDVEQVVRDLRQVLR
ncbi:MAG: SCO family protein [Chloroflexi bacterium]|nr:SCO family protein [Chloroflexota bacterium]